MYKAIKDIGNYRVGDVVPDSEAELWLEMYSKPHVEKVSDEKVVAKKSEEDVEEESKEIIEEKEKSLSDILEDYLGRNQSVIKKNLSEDRLSKNQLKELLKLEQKNKRRPLVINAIKQRLEA
jgi:hypothetical protein